MSCPRGGTRTVGAGVQDVDDIKRFPTYLHLNPDLGGTVRITSVPRCLGKPQKWFEGIQEHAVKAKSCVENRHFARQQACLKRHDLVCQPDGHNRPAIQRGCRCPGQATQQWPCSCRQWRWSAGASASPGRLALMQGPFRQVTDDYVKTCEQRRLAAMPVRPVPPTSKSPRLSFLRRCLAHDHVDAEQEDARRHGSVQLQPERCPPCTASNRIR